MSPKSALKPSIGVGIIVLLVQLVPFVFIGEYWGMIWYILAMPLSACLKGALWSSSSSDVYILISSVLSALLWTIVIYLGLRVLRARKGRETHDRPAR